MEKIKSRWRRNYLEGDIINNDEAKDNDVGNNLNNGHCSNINNSNENIGNNNHHHHHHHHSSKHSKLPTYEPLIENLYLDKRKNEHSKSRRDARSMVCDCILTKEERARGVSGCLDDCLNRMLMIECGPRCTLGDHCLNKNFQKCQYANVEVFKTKKKGWGLRAKTDIPANTFIMEYVGEVVRSKELRSRVKKYTKQKIKHHYFMALGSDQVIDATVKGNQTRFINHSCEPNCETQKWTVNGELRIGFFTIRHLQAGEEITFDYQFQRYGRKAQKCYCEAPSCRGYIGGEDKTFSLNGNSSPQFNENNPGFKIPRLNRLQRMEIEKKMDEEILSDETVRNDKLAFEQKNPFSSKIFSKSSTTATNSNSLINNSISKSSTILPTKRKFDSRTSNNIDLTPAQKISREEHRQQFEMHVRLKDYYDAIEKHYGPAVVEQIKLSQRAFNSINGYPLPYPNVTGQNLPYLMPNNLEHSIHPPIAPVMQTATSSNNDLYSHLIYPSIAIEPESARHDPMFAAAAVAASQEAPNDFNYIYRLSQQQQQQPQDTDPVIQTDTGNYMNESHLSVPNSLPKPSPPNNEAAIEPNTRPEPTKIPTLIVLANNLVESAHSINDKLASCLCDYDEFYLNRGKKISLHNISEDPYPHPGCYYTTPSGEIWFATVILDRKTHKPRNVVAKITAKSRKSSSHSKVSRRTHTTSKP